MQKKKEKENTYSQKHYTESQKGERNKENQNKRRNKKMVKKSILSHIHHIKSQKKKKSEMK